MERTSLVKCPACNHLLTNRHLNGVLIDVCDGGCGGMWLDAFELNRLDESHEVEDDRLIRPLLNPESNPSPADKRSCPRCVSAVMRRHFFSAQRDIEVDTCPQCGGVWLDCGELQRIRVEKSARSDDRTISVVEFLRQRRAQKP